jgi:beta-lactamase class A
MRWTSFLLQRAQRRLADYAISALLAGLVLGGAGCESTKSPPRPTMADYTLDFTTPTDPGLQSAVEAIDARLRARHGLTDQQTAVGVLDLRTLRLALVRPDKGDYAASVPKIGILLAYFQTHPEAATQLDPEKRHELGLMIKVSNNEVAAKYSQELGLKNIQAVLDSYHLYDAAHGGGLWVGKHYGKGTERYGDPVGNNSHAATVRQLLRYYLLLEQDKLVSPAASKTMREIFASPGIAHLQDKFVKGLDGRNLDIRHKAGWWEQWAHDTAVVSGPGRHYIVIAMTHHPKGEAYLVDFATAVDDLLAPAAK